MSSARGAVRLFHLWGIDVHLHWSWIVVAVIEIQMRRNAYERQFWNILEYLTLFLIVLLHEFGHAFAARSVGGKADRIMLWPLGGIAFVQTPPRPGAYLWSIAAGPLVNLLLVVPTFLLMWRLTPPAPLGPTDASHYAFMVFVINLVLLVFNLLPIYPLDGGQVVRGVLWFFVGQVRSLVISSWIGLAAAAIGLVWAATVGRFWLMLLALFAGSRCWGGIQSARLMTRVQALPRFAAYACPSCGQSPPIGGLWRCECGQSFDLFFSAGTCPACGATVDNGTCVFCGESQALRAWLVPEARAGASRAF